MSIWSELTQSYREGGYLTRLIYINTAVFVLVKAAWLVCTLFTLPLAWLPYIELPASIQQALHTPWTMLSYMFLHLDLLHILFNLLALYWFGRIFLEWFNQKQLVGVYVLGGIGGALCYLAGYNLIPYFRPMVAHSYLLGASASIMAVIFAVVTTAPQQKIRLVLIGEVQLRYLGIAMLCVDLLGVGATNAGGSMAHLGGAATGALYTLLLHKGIDLTAGITALINGIQYGIDRFQSIGRRSRPTLKVHGSPRVKTDAEWNQERHRKDSRIDEILLKIKQSGYDHLTEQEKKELFDLSH